jgi:hypothetical protein
MCGDNILYSSNFDGQGLCNYTSVTRIGKGNATDVYSPWCCVHSKARHKGATQPAQYFGEIGEE